jgi:outer membrane protein assembly factor BamA
MQRKLIWVAITFLPLLLALPMSAQQLLKPQSIRFDGAPDYTPDELLAATGVKKGQVYTSDYLNQTAQKLMSTGVFEKVGFKFDGVDLVYLLRESDDLYPVLIDNLPIDTGADLDTKLRQVIPLYHGKVPSEGGMLDDVRNALQSMLAAEGLDAKVVSVPAGNNPNKKATAIKFRIDTPPVEIGDIDTKGVSDALRAQVDGSVRFVLRSFDASTSAKHIEDLIASAYVGNGYPAAVIKAQRSGKPAMANDVLRVPFTVTVEEGRAYKLGTVQIAPGLPVAMSDVEKLTMARDRFKPESGYVIGLQHAVEARLKGKGYLDCKVTPKPEIDEAAGLVNYTIDAAPGSQYHLGLLKFENVGDTLRGLLMRNWQMMPGDPFDESYVANFIFVAQKSDPVLQRSLAGVKATYDVRADTETHDVNLVIHLQRQ